MNFALINSFFIPIFPFKKLPGSAALRVLDMSHSFQESAIVRVDPHQHGSNQVGDVGTPLFVGRRLSRLLVGAIYRTRLDNFSWGNLHIYQYFGALQKRQVI